MARIVGFGAERIKLPAHATREEIIEARQVMLARCLNLKTTVAFLGAGCSVPLGYPRWRDFARGAVHATVEVLSVMTERHDREYLAQLSQIAERLASSPAPGSADLLFYLGRCQRISRDLARRGMGDPYAEYVARTFGKQPPDVRRTSASDNPHMALLGLPISRFITSNYDI